MLNAKNEMEMGCEQAFEWGGRGVEGNAPNLR